MPKINLSFDEDMEVLVGKLGSIYVDLRTLFAGYSGVAAIMNRVEVMQLIDALYKSIDKPNPLDIDMREPDAYDLVTPQTLTAYVERHGWTRKAHLPVGNASVWRLDGNEILVPNDINTSDYTHHISHAISAIARLEQRTPLQVLFDIAEVKDGE